jgi:hypothetical protein
MIHEAMFPPTRWSAWLLSLCGASLVAAAGWMIQPPRESSSCQVNIVSSTVLAAYCGHRAGDDEMLDLLIAWRGEPGWFLRRAGTSGTSGSRRFGAGMKGRVSQSETYNGVIIAFDADFDAGTVAIGDVTVSLKDVNAILIDRVEVDEARRMTTTRIAPRLPLGEDVNLVMARRSHEFRQFLRCEVPMPAFPSGMSQPAIVTVCEKLASGRP